MRPPMKHIPGAALASLVGLCLAQLACSAVSAIPPTVTPAPPTVTPAPPPITPTASPDPTGSGNCFYTYASNDLPAGQLKAGLTAAGIAVKDATVYGIGEDYTCPEANSSTFGASASDLTITLQAGDLGDLAALGTTAGQVLDVLQGLPSEAAPNWQSGQTTLIYDSGGGQLSVKFPGYYGVVQRRLGLTDEALWQALNNQPCNDSPTFDPLPDLGAQIQADLDKAGVKGITVSAEAAGQKCVDPQTGAVESTTVQKTNFQITLEVADLHDRAALGDLAAQALATLTRYPPGVTPGADPGDIRFAFQAGGQREDYVILYTTGADAAAQGLKGAELMTLLETKYI